MNTRLLPVLLLAYGAASLAHFIHNAEFLPDYPGLALLAAHAMAGLDGLGHYVLAPFSAHSAAMNSTIVVEVAAAAFVLAEVARQMLRVRAQRP